jgi:hypothetical protein
MDMIARGSEGSEDARWRGARGEMIKILAPRLGSCQHEQECTRQTEASAIPVALARPSVQASSLRSPAALPVLAATHNHSKHNLFINHTLRA